MRACALVPYRHPGRAAACARPARLSLDTIGGRGRSNSRVQHQHVLEPHLLEHPANAAGATASRSWVPRLAAW
jgi:hypothetical protein